MPPTRLILITLCLLLTSLLIPHPSSAATAVTSSIQLYTAESEFLASVGSVSTETFDSATPDTGLMDAQVTLDHVVYAVDGPCFAEGSPNACWFFSGNHDQVSLPNEFGPTLTDPYSNVRIRFDGGFVHAFGYWEINAALDTSTPITYQVVVHDLNGTDTVIPITSHYGANYVGIQSSVGIASLTIRDTPGDGAQVGWWFDNVSHSPIIPFPAATATAVPTSIPPTATPPAETATPTETAAPAEVTAPASTNAERSALR